MTRRREACYTGASCIKYDVDDLAKQIWRNLLSDFRCIHGEKFAMGAEAAFNDMKAYREYKYPEMGIVDPVRFKCYKQLESLLKKYRFQHDAYTDEQLVERSMNSFRQDQLRLSVYREPTSLAHRVLRRARSVAKDILGEFIPENVIDYARVGRKSSIGCPLSVAYLDEKLSNPDYLTSSSKCATWFRSVYLKHSQLFSEYLPTLDESKLAHESLNLVYVPKTWKQLRGITPLTSIALMYSYGVGHLVEDKLREHGLDIRRLQNKHRRYVEEQSLRLDLATADLSNASQSLTSPLLRWILPRKWYNAISPTFAKTLHYNGEYMWTPSVLPMGNGLTFPVETLVFYCILRAISDLSGVRDRFISVYGDDLIYARRLHKYVAAIFPQLGLVLNLDKTFVTSPFRESCGSDFYRGLDVRPFILTQGECRHQTRLEYAATVFKAINGLRRRWNDIAISNTLSFLSRELKMVGVSAYRVPELYPDDSGVKCQSPHEHLFWADDVPAVTIKFTQGSRWYSFSHLTRTSQKRRVVAVWPYYWLSLGRMNETQLINPVFTPKSENFWECDYRSLFADAPTPLLEWRMQKRVRTFCNKRNGTTREIVKRVLVPYTSSRKLGVVQVVKHEGADKDGLKLSVWA